MVLKYEKPMAIIPFVVGILSLGVGIASGGPLILIALGAMLATLGVLAWTRPAVVLTPESIEMKNMLGMTLKTHDLTKAKVEVKDNKVLVDDKRRLGLWFLDTDEQSVREFLHRTQTSDS